MNTYLIQIGKTRTGYSAHCPDVTGCAATGPTVEDVVNRMRSALVIHLEGLVEDGEPIPRSRGVDSYRDVSEDADVAQYLLAHVNIDIGPIAGATS